MEGTITVRTSKLSPTGFWYYQKHKAMFTQQSFATLLTTVSEGIVTKSISAATKMALSQNVWVERDGQRTPASPETELEEGDEVVFWMPMGNIHYKVQNDKLILTR